jgi:hypothetical protein
MATRRASSEILIVLAPTLPELRHGFATWSKEQQPTGLFAHYKGM